jgi:hypothetical protein
MSSRTVLRGTFAFVVTLLLSVAAQAQLFRAYLAPSPAGSDANPCTLPLPCRLLPAALAAVADGGEIWMLDSANYNTATTSITKSVTILAIPGALGSVVAVGGPALSIATAGVKVKLRNLVIVPLPGAGGTDGISMTSGTSLTVQDCILENLPGSAIVVSGAAVVRIMDTTMRDNGVSGLILQDGARASIARVTISGNTAASGLLVLGAAAGTTTTADISGSTVDGNLLGIFAFSTNATAGLKVSVRDSGIYRNGSQALAARSDAGGSVSLSMSGSTVSNNGEGIRVIGGASKVWANANTVSNNGIGLINELANPGVLESAGNNALRNNGTDKVGTVAVIATE